MVERALEDLVALDHDVALAFNRLTAWRERLAAEAWEELADDPFDGLRHTASRASYQTLLSLSPSAADIPLRDALARWVSALVEARVGLASEVEAAQADALEDGLFEGDPRRQVSWRQAWRGLVLSKTPREAELWFDAARKSAVRVGGVQRNKAARRFEIARRMGLAHPWEPLSPVAPAELLELARRLLDATESIARAARSEVVSSSADAAHLIFSLGCRDAGEGWPARLSSTWFEDVFGPGIRRLRLRLPVLPRPAGAASFARALSAFGFAARVGLSTARSFALSREPAFAAAHSLGFAFGALPMDAEFHTRVLGLSPRTAQAQARLLTRCALFDVRLHAARLLLGDPQAFAPADGHREWTARVFGAPIERAFAGAFPRARVDEPARFIGLLGAVTLRRELRDQFDSDWFRNPRTWTSLQEAASNMPRPVRGAAYFAESVGAAAHAFEEALG